MTRSDGTVIIDTLIDTNGFEKGSVKLKSQFGSLSKATGKLGGAIAAAFSVQAVLRFGKSLVDASKEAIALGSDLQEVQNVVDVTFTTMNDQLNEFAKNADKTAGLSETMAKRYAGTFGAMAKSFQFTEEEAYNMSTALTQLVGDVASFYNITQDTAYTKLKAVFSGETEALKDLGVVMTQAALDDFAMRKGLKKTTNQMTEQEKVALRFQFIMEQLSGASGDFIRTSGAWANQTRLLKLQTDQLKATIGQGLINALTPSLKVVNTLIEKLQVLADKFVEFTTAAFGHAGGASDAMGALAGYAEKLEENIEAAGKTAKKALAPFDEITKIKVGGSDESTTIQPTTNKNENAENAASGVNKLSESFKKLLKVFKPLEKITFFKLSDSVKALFNALSPYGQMALDVFVFLLDDFLIPLTEWTIEDFLPAFLETLAALLEALTPILDGIKPTLDWLWNEILVPMAAYVGDSFVDFLYMLRDAFLAISEWASNNKDTVNDIFNIFLGFLAGVWVYNSIKKIVLFIDTLRIAIINFGTAVAAGGLQAAFFAAAVGILAAGIVALSLNWDKMSPMQRFIAIFAALAAAATAAAIAIAVFHTSWSVGVAAAAIVGGLALLGLSFAFSSAGTPADTAETAANNFYNSYDWNKNFSLPMLATGAVIPPNAPFAAILGDQKHGTNIEAPLSTIQEAVALVMEDNFSGMMRGFEETIAVQREILEVICGIQIGDEVIAQAVNRYNRKMNTAKGGA